jgi:hypothetical protein
VVPSYLGDKGMDLFDQGCALVRVYLVELQTILPEAQYPGQFPDFLEQFCRPPAAEFVVALLRRASHQHHPIGALFKRLEDDAGTHLPQAVNLEGPGPRWKAEMLSARFLQALVSIPIAGKDDDPWL